MSAFLILLGILFVIVVGVELLTRVTKMPLELSRKSTHILTGVAVALSSVYVPQEYRILLAVLFIFVIIISKRRGIFRSIHDADRRGIGDVWYPVGILFAAIAFPMPSVFTYAILILAVSDGFAGLIGKFFGKQKITFLRTQKTYLGFFVFIVAAVCVGLFVGMSLSISIVAAVGLAIIELLSIKGIDNLILPLGAGMIALLMNV